MTKCDFCPYSKRVFGKLICPYATSILSSDRIKEILAAISGIKG